MLNECLAGGRPWTWLPPRRIADGATPDNHTAGAGAEHHCTGNTLPGIKTCRNNILVLLIMFSLIPTVSFAHS